MTTPRQPIVLFDPYVAPQARELAGSVLEKHFMKHGLLVQHLETQIRQSLEFPYPVAVSSGTAAVHLALSVAGVREYDEVITTPMTCAATNLPILQQKALPVFADIQRHTGNLDPKDVQRRITPRTRAILCVDFAGYPCDLTELNAIADRHGVPLIEDAAQAIGAEYEGKPIGTVSKYTTFSFGRSKHVTSGDGGLLVLQNEDDYCAAVRDRFYGFDPADPWPRLNHPAGVLANLGFKYDMNNLNAALVLGNLNKLSDLVDRRQQIADRYRNELAEVPGLELLEKASNRTHAQWVFMVHVEKRGDFTKRLADHGIQTWIMFVRNDHYDIFGGRRDDLSGMNEFEKTYTAIPCHNLLKDEDVDRVIHTICQGW